jgi:uncharacterized damage-inducible protein DinB
MTSDDLRTLLDYHYWARDRMLDAVEPLTAAEFTRAMGSSFASIRDTLVHTYSSEWAWHSRWQGTSPTAHISPDRFPAATALRAPWRELEQDVRATLEALADSGIERVFEYTMFNGQAGATPFSQMVQHMVNHASYHRGQVTTMLRQLGAQPAKGMDLLAFYRERAAGR